MELDVRSPSLVVNPREESLLGGSDRPWLHFIRTLAISGGIGLGLALIMGLNDPSSLNPAALLVFCVIGVSIAAGSVLTEWLLLPRLIVLRLRPVLLSRCICYFLGGMAGYWLGINACRMAFAQQLSVGSSLLELQATLLYGGMSVVIGLTFHTVDSLRGRLAEKETELREKEYAERELETARQIQQRLMPPEVADGPGFSLCARNRAARIVAGDFYDYFYLPDGTMGFAMADVAGKGMGASLQMAMVKAVLPMIAAERAKGDNPVAGTLDDLNERLCRELGPREFVALLYGRFDPVAKTMELANGGLPDPYWICRKIAASADEVEALSVPGDRLPLGIRSATRYQSTICDASSAGVMVMVTDGLIERTAGDGPLGYERFESILASVARSQTARPDQAPKWLERLQYELDAASGASPEDDDCTAMVICSGSPLAEQPNEVTAQG